MSVRLHPHAVSRLAERGATVEEVVATVVSGRSVPARANRRGFQQEFAYGQMWRGRRYATKQVTAYAVDEDGWLVITVVVKFFADR